MRIIMSIATTIAIIAIIITIMHLFTIIDMMDIIMKDTQEAEAL